MDKRLGWIELLILVAILGILAVTIYDALS